MTLRRIVPALAATLVVMTAVVLLRTDAARRNFKLLRLENRERVLLEEVREKELELARLRNPALIRETLTRECDGEQKGD